MATVAVFWQARSFAARVFFSNLAQPGDQYGPDGLGIGHTPAYLAGDTGEVFGATGFTPSAACRLTFIGTAIGSAALFALNGANQVDLFLVNDSGGLASTIIALPVIFLCGHRRTMKHCPK